jgi:3-phenylpropionate/trans-cinnamate dioxygenase ferredoxin reductase subunit
MPMSTIERIVIVGAGVAGGRAAESLRKEGYEGRITLLGEEPERPYSRPPLSKGYLRGEKERSTVYIHPDGFYDENRIDLRPGTTVSAIDLAGRSVALADGTSEPFDRLLLATGAQPRRLPVPGADLPGVLVLRTLADSDAIKAAVADAQRIVVVGASWIGCEVAASLRALDRQVTMVAPEEAPLVNVVGPDIGQLYRDLHAAHGVQLRLRSRVARIVGPDRATAVELESGQRLDADLVITGVGVEPRTDLATAAGLAVNDGIEVDARLQASAPGVFAAGDVASAWHPFYERRIRTEHISNARLQGLAVGPLLLDRGQPFDKLPSFYSDQYGVSLQYTGLASAGDPMVVRGSLADRQFTAFLLQGGRVAAAITVGKPDPALDVEGLIRSRVVVDPAVLADESASIGAPATA